VIWNKGPTSGDPARLLIFRIVLVPGKIENAAMLLRRVILSVAVVLALVSPCRSQSFGNEEVEGLCIYKSRISLPDKVATLFEYRTSVEYPSTSYIFPVSRRRIRLSPDAEIRPGQKNRHGPSEF